MSRFLRKKSQSLIEYSLILAIVGAALMGMQVYMKRSLQAVVKISTDQLGPQQGQQVLINYRRQASTVSRTTATRVGGVRTQVSAGDIQRRDTGSISTSSGTSTSVSSQ